MLHEVRIVYADTILYSDTAEYLMNDLRIPKMLHEVRIVYADTILYSDTVEYLVRSFLALLGMGLKMYSWG